MFFVPLRARVVRTALAGLCLLTAAACGNAGDMTTSASVVSFAQGHRKAAPDLTGPLVMTGKPFSVAGQRGHVVVVNYWASWCVPCAEDVEPLNDLYTDFSPHGVTFVGVDFHGDGAHDSVPRAFLKGHHVLYDSLVDRDSRTVLQFARNHVTIAAPPVTVVIDKQGNVAALENGVVDYSKLRDTIERLNAEAAT